MINIIDLFSGGGGLTEGFRGGKFNIVTHVEMNQSACETLRLRDSFFYLKLHKQLPLYSKYIQKKISANEYWKNIPLKIKNKTLHETISKESLESIFQQIDQLRENKKINGIIGGPPCQAYSTIGRARNAEKKDSDERIYLYKYYTKFLQHYKPEFFVFENVKGLKSFNDSDGHRLLPQIKEEFSDSLGKDSYIVEFRIIDASSYGVPQKRERLIIFGYKASLGKISFFNSLKDLQEKPISIKNLLQDMPFMHSGQTVNHYGNKIPCNFVSRWLRTTATPLTQNIARPNNVNDLLIYKIVATNKLHNKNTRYPDLPEKLITHHKRNIFLDRFKALPRDTVSHTIVAHIAKDGHHYIHPDVLQNRSITVREAARIQTFPDNYYFENSRTAAFTQIGNAVPPYLSKKLSEAVLRAIYL